MNDFELFWTQENVMEERDSQTILNYFGRRKM
jgi:hypothetical protein